MMDRVEWTKEIEAEAADLRRELAETKMTKAERRHRQAYLECLEIMPQLSEDGATAAQRRNTRRRDCARCR